MNLKRDRKKQAAALSDTSALVLLWAQGTVHTSSDSRAYLNMLDLGSGGALLSRCNAVWPHYDQVIKNRKKCVLDLALQHMRQGRTSQVAIFGAGLDALSVELASTTRRRDLRIYDVDAANMGLKDRLIGESTSDAVRRSVRCVEAELSDPRAVARSLQESGWDGLKPSILIFEGISYYLSRENLFELIGLFASGRTHQNVAILEYILRQDRISRHRRHIPNRVFDAIMDQRNAQITRYAKDEITLCAENVGGKIVKNYNQKEMEKSRCGGNRHFKTDCSGWINVSCMLV